MAIRPTPLIKTQALISIYEESKELWNLEKDRESRNPVIKSAEFAYKATDLVQINDDGVKSAAKHLRCKLLVESYTPRTWRTHPLHLCPSDTYDLSEPMNRSMLDWIFLISSLNFSFWSEKEGRPDRYGVEWRAGWGSDEIKVWTGYWALVASLNRALEEEIPITDPRFYSSEILCPDSLIEYVFRATKQSNESIPLLGERIAIMREVGYILCNSYGGSFKGFLDEFKRQHQDQGTSLDLVKMVTQSFPSFRDEVYYENTKVFLWKRAQIMVAEIWAAFYPASQDTPHPLFRGIKGPEISSLTMFADYRVPQILHHLCILKYPASLLRKLNSLTPLAYGCREEVSLRSASIVAVERVREEILRLIKLEGGDDTAASKSGTASSVIIDFYLWDLAKRVERGEEKIEGIKTAENVPTHRTRSIWY
ncbi:hypothetical protein BYT27DRAFT_7122461 [Phlegmacium glaucopus]|nr:hypothetical protein BYT27DRAFT_7122461 [Phlegmacium glaucopus]